MGAAITLLPAPTLRHHHHCAAPSNRLHVHSQCSSPALRLLVFSRVSAVPVSLPTYSHPSLSPSSKHALNMPGNPNSELGSLRPHSLALSASPRLLPPRSLEGLPHTDALCPHRNAVKPPPSITSPCRLVSKPGKRKPVSKPTPSVT